MARSKRSEDRYWKITMSQSEIVIIGSEQQAAETMAKFGPRHNYFTAVSFDEAETFFGNDRVVFDFSGSVLNGIAYSNSQMVVFLDTTLTSLASLAVSSATTSIFGFCGLPTFVNRPVIEVSARGEKSQSNLKRAFEKLGSDYVVVADKPGLVTPRVICMIINEAYYTVEEGIASREDIDMAMKLGTNYPWGPFEWGHRIGLDNVRALLKAMHKDSNDDRYQICRLLENEP
jgi:3-hydroxybutyryl-CoA dehydrogenase